jgi:hypothetical protein
VAHENAPSANESSETFGQNEVEKAIETLDKAGLIDWGIAGSESEFFVTGLKDKNAAPSLFADAAEAERDDPEWAAEVRHIATRARTSPWKKRPDEGREPELSHESDSDC